MVYRAAFRFGVRGRLSAPTEHALHARAGAAKGAKEGLGGARAAVGVLRGVCTGRVIRGHFDTTS
jgi:hypothetical protein